MSSVVVVTGAGKGLGKALCGEFAARGFRVAGFSRGIPIETENSDIILRRVDVRDAEEVLNFADEVVSAFGRIDAWINNAAVMDPFRVADGDVERWRLLLDTNVLGVVHGSQAFAQHVRGRSGGGVLVNLTASSARRARGYWAGYAASKAAVERITEAMADEERAVGLKAFNFSPGAMDTDMQRALWKLSEAEFPEAEMFRERAAAGLISDCRSVAAEVAERVAALLPPGASTPELLFSFQPHTTSAVRDT
ncbi:SDR family oxidoreductase [Streptomyces californicus]|uniref:SDR family oxidoreductase n=1 Tax=Streptomyces californicus TaxID=67351 RepID=UPI00296E86FA|nr:SDR family oxidoreductase [Streptomyces californicus]MDW4903368.1 SDR family oxidoreductase [Streptomyces californicus]